MKLLLTAFLAIHQPSNTAVSVHGAFGKNVTNLYMEEGNKLRFFKCVDTVAFIDIWKEVKASEVLDYSLYVSKEEQCFI